jgi:ketosteroid isomerase-like protein
LGYKSAKVATGSAGINTKVALIAHTTRIVNVIEAWVEAFNRAGIDALVGFYGESAVKHQVAESPVVGAYQR